MVYAHATQRGMRVTARLYHPTKGKNGSFETIADYSWRPREVTELAIVEWACKALARWLEGQLMPETDS